MTPADWMSLTTKTIEKYKVAVYISQMRFIPRTLGGTLFDAKRFPPQLG